MTDNKKSSVWINILMVLTCVLFVTSFAFTGVMAPDAQTGLNLLLFPVGVILFVAVVLIDLWIIKWGQKTHTLMQMSNGRYFAINAVAMTVIGLIFQIVYFPGIMNNDSIYIIRGGLGLSSQHPWMYIVLMKVFRKIAWVLGGTDALAIMSLTFVQNIAVSCVFSYCLIWLKNKQVPKVALIIIDIFFLFCPILNLYKITLIKDVPFSLGMMLLFPLMYDLWISKGEILRSPGFTIKMFVCEILMFFRNNGVYTIAVLIVVLMIAYRKHIKPLIIQAAFIVLLIASGKMVQRHVNASYMQSEALGVPLQQVAAAVVNEGSISEDEYAFINEVIPLESIRNNYNPYSVDPLKFTRPAVNNEFLNDNRGQFLKVWFSLLCKNPQIYVDAYFRSTYGFWSFSGSTKNMRYTYLGAFAKKDTLADWIQEQKIEQKSILPSGIQNVIESILTDSSVFLGAGTLAFIFLILLVCLMKKKGAGFILVGLPDLLCHVTLLMASPIAFQWRYALSLAYVIPLMYGVAMIKQANAPEDN